MSDEVELRNLSESMEVEEAHTHTTTPPSTKPEDPSPEPSPSTPTPQFDPSRMIGIIRRKALIKELAAGYHSECLTYCQELLEFQKQLEEPYLNTRHLEDSRKGAGRGPKRMKKSR